MTKHTEWQTGEVLAYTEREGPGRPPLGPPRWALGVLAGILGAAFVGLFSSPSLCPEHRAWVLTLSSITFTLTGAAFVALARGWASAVWLTLAAAAGGIAIAIIDAFHSPVRGLFVVAGFAAAILLAAGISWQTRRLEVRDDVLGDHEPSAEAVAVPVVPSATRTEHPSDEATITR